MTNRTSEQAGPFVDKRTDGPGVARIDPSDPADRGAFMPPRRSEA